MQSWPVIKPSAPFVDSWHIGAICEHLQAVHCGQIRKLLVNIPPRCAKSSTVSVAYPAWKWIHQPEHKFLAGSHAMPLAIRDSVAMRRLIQSPWYQERWGRGFNLVDNSDWGDPDGFVLTDDQNAKLRFENDRSGYRIAFSFGTSVLGDGADTLIVDDPHDTESAHSDVQLESDITKYRTEISTRLEDPAKSATIVIMQRLVVDDLSAYLLAQGGVEHLLLPMHYNPRRSKVTCLGWKDPRTEEGQLLDPIRFPEEIVTEWEARLLDAASGQFEQEPEPPGGGILKREGWRFYNIEDGLPDVFEKKIQSWDLAFKKTAVSNFVAGQPWGRSGSRCYLFPAEVYERLSFTESCDRFAAFSVDFPFSEKLVEDAANGPALESTLGGKVPGIRLVKPDGGVIAVAHSVAPYVAAGNVWMPNPYLTRADSDGRVPINATVNPEMRWVLRLIANAATFPNGSIPPGSHGDDVAALVQAVHHLMHDPPKRKAKIW